MAVARLSGGSGPEFEHRATGDIQRLAIEQFQAVYLVVAGTEINDVLGVVGEGGFSSGGLMNKCRGCRSWSPGSMVI